MIKSMEKMIEILSLYSSDCTQLSIKEIQDELNMPKSTVFRILNTLEAHGYIHKNDDTHLYALGYQFFRLGSIYQSNLDYRRVALPEMKKLMEDTKETVELNILDGSSRVCIEKIDSPLDVRSFVRVGERKQAYLGASGKVLLAFLSDEEQQIVLKQIQSEEKINIKKLKDELVEIRSNGYAFTQGERIVGSFAIATPILGVNGTLVAGLTIAGPLQRLSEERISVLKTELIKTAKTISNYLGYFE
ncbi:IclR family transcriptional regulator [Ureibacillus aquaedulcis]|uniref:IclR family transcriptional regulator n=1 Tax=Ureibacillus aquaedulcis TaxID=3058421 RepID=A0ABT8GKQ2_9BACL|nr:IclR family transcriptional regulator [Ureibacillus sp. BA0131]MDN4491990.1 IclR family transcriptional regulator [Ureibacillus sp. BA0131]